jgi:hypothetical protein
MINSVFEICSIIDEITPPGYIAFNYLINISSFVHQGRTCLEIEKVKEEPKSDKRGLKQRKTKKAWSPTSRALQKHLDEALEDKSSIWRDLYIFGGSMKAVIIFSLICILNADRKSKESPVQKVEAWPPVMRRVLATMLERLETHPEMSAYINIQDKPAEHETRSYRPKVKAEEYEDEGEKEGDDGMEGNDGMEGDDGIEGDDGKEGEDESEAKDEKEGCRIIALLKESIEKLKGLLLCGNDDEVEDELPSRKHRRIEPPTNKQSSNPSQTSIVVDSHVHGQSETALQRCLGL